RIILGRKYEASQNFLDHIFYESTDLLLLVDPADGHIHLANNQASQYFKISSEDNLAHTHINSLLIQPFTPNQISIIDKSIRGDNTFKREMEFARKDGTKFYASVTIKSISIEFPKYIWLVRISDESERYASKKETEQNRKMLYKIIDIFPHKIYLKDQKSRFLLVNQSVAEDHKKTKEELIGKSDMDLFDPETANILMAEELEILGSGKDKVVKEETFEGEDGTKHIYQTTKIPFYIDELNEMGILGVNIDITDIKQAEAALVESEARFRMLMEQASDGIYLADAAGLIIDANPRACQMFGYEKAEFIGLNIKNLIDNTFAGSGGIIQSNNFSKKNSVIVERQFIKKDGTSFVVELSATLLADGTHQGIIRDITERKTYDDMLKENEKKFRTLIENSSDIICILDTDFKIKFVSSSSLRILGFLPKRLENQDPIQIVHPEDRQKSIDLMQECLKTKDVLSLSEVRLRNNDDEYIYFEVFASNFISDSIINGIVLNCHSINERKKTENKLLDTNYELDSFVYKASHDIKAPLRSVMGLIAIAKKEFKEPRLQIYLEMMNKSVLNLDTFIRDLTLFSRNSRQDIVSQQIDIQKLINESLESLRHMENVDKITISTDIPKGFKFNSDITRVSTIMNNLISNSLKYHKFEPSSSFVKITVRENQEVVIITVEDNGLGIEEKYVDKIFDMFFRASDKSYGSGLGLYIVKTALQKVKGTIEVQSRINEGSIFTVKIPKLKN
ncbi:MAG: PAS domain-containing sensor histidine kinase, partial [Cytophagales bacterium]|nr:PAS domain-containing sensor histidine kinase [Cytophagales bacterium]